MGKELTQEKIDKLETKLNVKIEDGKLSFADKLLADDDKRVKLMAIRVIAEHKLQQYLTTFVSMAENPGDTDIRVAAAQAVGTINYEPMFVHMLRIYEQEQNADVKEAVRLTMRKLHARKED